MGRPYVDHSGATIGKWKLVKRIANPQQVHLYQVQCTACAEIREASFQRLERQNVRCASCATVKQVSNGGEIVITLLGDKLELHYRKTPDEYYKSVSGEEIELYKHARIFHGMGRSVYEIKNRLAENIEPLTATTTATPQHLTTASTASNPVIEHVVTTPLKSDDTRLEVLKSEVRHFSIHGEPYDDNACPPYIKAWLGTHKSGTTYVELPHKPGWSWVVAVPPRASDDDWLDDLPPFNSTPIDPNALAELGEYNPKTRMFANVKPIQD